MIFTFFEFFEGHQIFIRSVFVRHRWNLQSFGAISLTSLLPASFCVQLKLGKMKLLYLLFDHLFIDRQILLMFDSFTIYNDIVVKVNFVIHFRIEGDVVEGLSLIVGGQSQFR